MCGLTLKQLQIRCGVSPVELPYLVEVEAADTAAADPMFDLAACAAALREACPSPRQDGDRGVRDEP